MSIGQLAHRAVLGKVAKPTYSQVVLSDSPIRYWRLGDSSGPVAIDSSVSAANGSYFGSPTYGQTGLIANDANTCVLFNTHATDYMRGTAIAAVISGQANFTIEFWVKTSDTTTGGYWWTERPPSGNDIIRFGASADKSQISLTYRADAATINGFGSATGLTLADGHPHHIVLTKAGTMGSVTFYVDGQQSGSVSTLTANDTFTNGSITSAMGKDVEDPGGGLQATYVQEIALYTTALSAPRILAHYDSGKGL